MCKDFGYCGPCNQHYLKRIEETLKRSLNEFPRTFVLRIDLRLPDENYQKYCDDSTLMTKFIESLKSQIKHAQNIKSKQGARIRPCSVRYVWAREFGEEKGKKHYHVALMLNNDVYCRAGKYYQEDGQYYPNLALKIMDAWVRALKLNAEHDYQTKYYPLIEFVTEGDFNLNINGKHFSWHYDTIMRRLSYLAKLHSKEHPDEHRNFGCSQS